MKKTFLLTLLCPFLLATQESHQATKTLNPATVVQPSNPANLEYHNLIQPQNRFFEVTLGWPNVLFSGIPFPHLRFGLIKPLKNQNWVFKPAFGSSIFFHSFEFPLYYKFNQKFEFFLGADLHLGLFFDNLHEASAMIGLGFQCCGEISHHYEWTIRFHPFLCLRTENDIVGSGLFDLLSNNSLGISYKF